jgi:hypothetical protein
MHACVLRWTIVIQRICYSIFFVVAYPTVFGLKREEVGGECRQLHDMGRFVTGTAWQILLG